MQEILSQLLKDMIPPEFNRQYLYSWELIIKTKERKKKKEKRKKEKERRKEERKRKGNNGKEKGN